VGWFQSSADEAGSQEPGRCKAHVGFWQVAAQRLKEEPYALYPTYRAPRANWYARSVVALLIGYVFLPIRSIPDFIPGVGLLDEMIVVLLGVILVRKMILAERRERAREVMREGKKPVSHVAAVVVALWLLPAALGVVPALRTYQGFGT
jgi:uncharacterized membrane protein YkvA (DUF1232 family)